MKKSIDNLIDGYFDGTLTRKEENRLKAFLISRKGQSEEYDSVRAVVGYYATGKRLNGCDSPQWLTAGICISAAAVCIVLSMLTGLLIHKGNNVYVASRDGETITDREIVMDDLKNTLADIMAHSNEAENQLIEIFGK